VIALLKPSCRFASFVVAPTNQLAVTAARAAAESPGRVYNPLYVYGAPGLGKTHLLMAVGHAVLEIDPSLTVEYLSIEEFGTAWPTAQEAGQGDAYRRHYIEADVLLLDDVHLLAYRRDLQLEILPILDGILEQNHQMVIASDRAPNRIDGLDERLVRQFASGLVTDVAASRPETRLEIARRKALERGVTFHPEVLELLAGAQLPDTRQLVAAVDRFREVQTRTRRPLSVDSARGLLQELHIEVSVGSDHDGRAEESGGGGGAEPDEFGEFLSDVTTTVAGQLEAWRSKVAEAILRWEGEGFRTQRLEALLKTDLPADPEAILRSFVADVERLRGLEAEADGISSDLTGSPLFRDPDQVAAAAALVEHARQGRHPLPAPSPIWRLEDLVEAAGNQVAVQLAWSVVDKPGAVHNPCVVVGGNGCGKTHLLHGIANKLAALPNQSVACIGATDMVAELEEARDQGRLTAWRSRYRVATALLIDDIHRWTDQRESAVELVELFEALLHARAQLVVTSAVPLPSLHLDSRLTARLEGGLVVTLPPPDRDICVRVVERLLAAKLSLVDPQLTSYLASRPVDSVRSLQGLVQRVLNNAEVHGKGPTVAFAREILEGLPSPTPKREKRLRSSGVVMPMAGGLRSREKMVWHWPDPSDRVLEEWS
jgi:chromosomal replication initiation ATPase DnaA